MRFQIPMLPNLPGTAVRLRETLAFLKDPRHLGSHTFTWECPISKQLVGFTVSRKPGDYYRDTILFLTVIAPNIPSLPQAQYTLSSTDVTQLISALDTELVQ